MIDADPIEGLVAHLATHTVIRSLVGEDTPRIYCHDVPQGLTQPHLVLVPFSAVPDVDHDGDAGLTATRVQIDCIASGSDGLAQARRLGRAVHALLSETPVAIGDHDLQSVDFLQTGREDFARELRHYVVSLDVRLWIGG
jgi:hypothetical protein